MRGKYGDPIRVEHAFRILKIYEKQQKTYIWNAKKRTIEEGLGNNDNDKVGWIKFWKMKQQGELEISWLKDRVLDL